MAQFYRGVFRRDDDLFNMTFQADSKAGAEIHARHCAMANDYKYVGVSFVGYTEPHRAGQYIKMLPARTQLQIQINGGMAYDQLAEQVRIDNSGAVLAALTELEHMNSGTGIGVTGLTGRWFNTNVSINIIK